MTRVIGPPKSRRRRWTFLAALAVMVGLGVLIIPGALATAPQQAGFFELDKNATDGLTTAHVGVNQSNLRSNTTAIPVCEYSSTAGNTPSPLAAGSVLLIDGEKMTFQSYGSTSSSTGGCSFSDPGLTATQVRTYNVLRGQGGTTAAAHAGDSDITLLTTSPNPAGNDWDQVNAAVAANPNDKNPCAALTGSVACDFVTDPPGITIFTGGSSDIADINTWTCTNQSVPDADEILDAYAIKYSNSTQMLYFGADRFATNGSKDFGFWFFKNPISSSGATISNTCPTGSFSGGNHIPGDVLLLGTFTQGGAIATIRAFTWVTSGGDVSAHLQSEGTFGDCVPGSGTANACNTVNNSTIPSPWSYTGKSAAASNVIYSGGFMEGGIDLGALGLSGCFSSFMAETRSSPSLTAELKDFTIGKFESCGSDLVTTPKAADGTTNLTADTNNNNLVETSIGTGTVQVRDSAALTVNGISPFSGTLSFHICGPINTAGTTCATGGVDATPAADLNPGPSVNGTYTSNAVTLTSAGRYCWRADFVSGTTGVPDAHDSRAESSAGTGECFEVLPVQTSLATQAVLNASGDAIPSGFQTPLGGKVWDTATLSGAATQPGTNGGTHPGFQDSVYTSINATSPAAAGGKITFTLKGYDGKNGNNPNCTDNAVAFANTTDTNPQDVTSISGNATYGPVSFSPDHSGTYHWVAVYTPAATDVNNLGSNHNTDCTDTAHEDVVVQQIPTNISTTQKVYPQDSATITSTLSGDNIPPGGTVTFYLYGGDTAANNLANCQAHGTTLGSGGLIDLEAFSTNAANGNPGPANSETFATNNTTHAVSTNTTVYWRVTYATGDSAHSGKQSDCAESTATTFVNSTGNGTAFP